MSALDPKGIAHAAIYDAEKAYERARHMWLLTFQEQALIEYALELGNMTKPAFDHELEQIKIRRSRRLLELEERAIQMFRLGSRLSDRGLI